jgi:hypothetical protein
MRARLNAFWIGVWYTITQSTTGASTSTTAAPAR